MQMFEQMQIDNPEKLFTFLKIITPKENGVATFLEQALDEGQISLISSYLAILVELEQKYNSSWAFLTQKTFARLLPLNIKEFEDLLEACI